MIALREILARAGIDGGRAAVDVGAGNGLWAVELAARYPQVVAVEPDRDLQRAIRQRSAAVTVVAGALPGTLPLPDKSFDLVSCLDVIEHLDDDRASLRELVRIAAPGAHLLLTCPAGPRLWSDMDDLVGHKRRYTRQSLDALTSSAALERVVLAPLNVWLYPIAAVMRRFNRTGERKPSRLMNAAIARVFASEARLSTLWPRWVKGLSLVYVGRVPS